MLSGGYQPNKGKLDKWNPPKGGSGLRCINYFGCESKKLCLSCGVLASGCAFCHIQNSRIKHSGGGIEIIKKEVIEFLIGQKGNKGITAMEKLKYNEVINFIEQNERDFDIWKGFLKIFYEANKQKV